MKRAQMQKSWKEISDPLQKKWPRLTTRDLERAEGRFTALAIALQERYGKSKTAAERDLDAFVNELELPEVGAKDANASGAAPGPVASSAPGAVSSPRDAPASNSF